MTYEFKADLWAYPGEAAWFFLTLPKTYAAEIKLVAEAARRGFGSVKVTALIGKTTWRTSLFPDKKTGSFLLPVKKVVRLSEGLRDGDAVSVRLTIDI